MKESDLLASFSWKQGFLTNKLKGEYQHPSPTAGQGKKNFENTMPPSRKNTKQISKEFTYG